MIDYITNKINNASTINDYYVMVYDFNRKEFVPYNVIPYFKTQYNKKYKNHIKSYKDVLDFIKKEARYQFWGRCEYEIILKSWPLEMGKEEKIDVCDQIMLNINSIANILIKTLKLEF